MRSIRTWLLAVAAASALFAGNAAAQVTHRAYLDLDSNAATGCSVATPAGNVVGIEARLTATVSGQPPMVTAVTRENCVGAAFGAPISQPAGYPVGVNIGVNGADVVEFSTSLAGLGNGGPANITFVSQTATGADIVIANGVFLPGQAAAPSQPAIIPATGILGLLLLAGLVLWLVRKHPRFGASMALLLLFGAGVVWAANFVTDGQIGDWVGVPPRATDANNDATSAEMTIEIVAVFAEVEGGNLFLRVDVRDAQNQPPVANTPAAVVLNEDGSTTITLTGSDAENAALTFAIATNPTRGTLGPITPVNATTATVLYTATANQNGADSFTFTVNDGSSSSTAATVSITITAVNDAPVVAPATFTVVENSPNGTVVGTATATDVDTGQTLTWSITAGNTGGAFVINPATGQITVASTAAVVGTTFALTVQATDNGTPNQSDTDTVTINVTGVNDEPSFTAGPNQTAVEDDPAVSVPWATNILAGPADEAGQTLTFFVSNDNNTLFSVQPAVAANGTLTYTLAPNANGVANVAVFLRDNGGTAGGGDDTSPTQNFTITVTAVNDTPSFALPAAPNQNVLQNSGAATVPTFATAISAGPSDESAQVLSFNVSNDNNALFSAQPSIAANGTLSFTPAAGAVGTATITVTLSDNGGGAGTSAAQTFVINVNIVNQAPTFNATADPAASLEDAGAQVVPAFVQNISDGDASVVQVVSFNVTGNTNAALFSAGPAIDGNGQLTYTAAANANGTADVTFVAVDDGGTANGGNNTSTPDTFTITVTAVNDVPAFTAGPTQNVLQNSGAATVPGFATALSAGPADESGQTLTFAAGNDNNALFSAQPAIAANGTLTFTPANNAVGTATVTVTLQDNGGVLNGGVDTSGPQQFIINVTIVNQAPSFTATTDPAASLEDGGLQTVAGFVTGINDGDATVVQTVSFNITGNTNTGLFLTGPAIDVNGQLTYTANPNANGTADITFVAQDDGGTANGGANTSAPDVFTITVTPINDEPSFAAGSNVNVAEDSGPQTVSPWATAILAGPADESGQTLTFTATVTGTTGTLVFTTAPAVNSTTGVLSFTAQNGTNGTATVDVSLGDNGGVLNGGDDTSPIQTFTITVSDVNEAPAPTGGPFAIAESAANGAVVGTVAPNDPDVGNTHTFAITGGNTNNVFVINASSGQITVANPPGLDFETTPSYTLTIDVTDNGAPPLTGIATVTINVTDANEAPAVSAGGTLAYTEGTGAVVLSNSVSVTDPDAGEGLASATVQITGNLASAEDVLAFANTANITGVYTAATGTLVLTGADTPAAYQVALRSVTYANSSNAPSTLQRTVSWSVNDGALGSNVATSTIDVTTTNSAPVVATSIGSSAYVENGPAVSIDGAVTATDVDSPNATSALVQITGGLQSAEDVLAFVNTPNITGLYFPATGELQLSGTDTFANYQLAMRSVTYSNNSDAPNTGARTISFSVIDNGAPGLGSNVATKTVTVAAGNDAPVVTLSGSAPSFTEGGAPVVVDGGVAVSDVDDTNIESATVTITNAFAGDVLSGTSGGGVTVSGSGTAALTLTGSASLAAYNAVLQGVTFGNGTDSPDPTARLVRFVANDGDANSNSADKTVSVVAVNDAPFNTFPAAPVTNEDTALTFTGANVISVADADAAAGAMSVTLTATQGTIDADNTGGATITNDGTASVTLTGTLAQINATLDGTIFNPTLNFFGAASVTVLTSDNGNTGTGGALTDTDVVAITVNPVNDAPVADDETFDTLGHTELRIDLAAAATPHTIETTGSGFGVRDGDADPVEGHAFTVTSISTCGDVVAPFDCTVNGLTISMNANGTFSVVPSNAVATGAPTTATFDYVITDDPLGAGVPATDTGTVTVNVFDKIWYVDAGAAGGGTGQSHSPLNSYTGINGAGGGGDGDGPGEIVFVHNDATTLIGSLELEANQRLWGEGFGLSLPNNLNGNGSPTVLVAAGTDAPVSGTDAVRVANAMPSEIRGLALTGTGGGNAIDISTTAAMTGSATLTIDGNTINGAAAEGIDINFNTPTTGRAIAITNNTWNLAGTHTGNAIDVNNTNVTVDTLRLDISNNSGIVSAGSGIVVNGGGVLRTTITGFANNSVHGNSVGTGINVSSVTFDATAGGAIQQVDGNNIAVGASGNPVGGNGLAVTNTQGDLFFDDMDVFAAGEGLTLSGVGSGLTFAVLPVGSGGTSSIDADNGPALNMNSAAIDLRLSSLQSNTSTSGVSIQGTSGQFSAPAGSAITKISGGGVAFLINGSSLTSDYAGSLDVTSGPGVALTTNTGTMTFRGGMTLSTGANVAFNATGGGTVHVCDESPCNPAATGPLVNTLATTTGTALTVNGTNIGANDLEFRSISTNGAANGIVLNTTGATGGLWVKGAGTAGSGGTIQNGASGILMTSTRDISLDRMQLNDHTDFAIRGTSVVNFAMANTVINGTNGNDAATDEGSVRFNELTGTASITNSSIAGAVEHNVQVINTAGLLNRITVSGTTFGAMNTTTGSDALLLETLNSAVINATVQNNFFTFAIGDHFQFAANATSANDVVFSGNTVSNTGVTAVSGGGGLRVVGGANAGPINASATFDLIGNNVRDSRGTALATNKLGGNGTFSGVIENNNVGVAAVANSGSLEGTNIFFLHDNAGSNTVAVRNNTSRQYTNFGIFGQVGGSGTVGSGTLNATVTGNTVSNPGTAVFIKNGAHLNGGTTVGDAYSMCFDLGGAGALANSVVGTGTDGGDDFRVRQRQNTTVRLPGYGGAAADTAAVVAFVQGRNTGAETGSAAVSGTGGGFVGGAACPQP